MLSNVIRTVGLMVGVSAVVVACTPAQDDDSVASVSQEYGELSDDYSDLPTAEGDGSGMTYSPVEPSKDGTSAGRTGGGVLSECSAVNIIKVYNGSTGGFAANTRLTQADVDGYVPCIYTHDDKYPVGKCRPKANWSYGVGQAVVNGKTVYAKYYRTGEFSDAKGSGSDWATAARVTTKYMKTAYGPETHYFVPCSPGGGNDSAGTAAGAELAGACTIEAFNVNANASGRTMDNYATRKVCSKTPATSDTTASAVAAGTDATGATCYTGDGAGLNDVNGTERNSANVYLTGSTRCHTAWSGGFEVYAGKRPATKGYPAPGVVDTLTAVWWRPVSSVNVAN